MTITSLVQIILIQIIICWILIGKSQKDKLLPLLNFIQFLSIIFYFRLKLFNEKYVNVKIEIYAT